MRPSINISIWEIINVLVDKVVFASFNNSDSLVWLTASLLTVSLGLCGFSAMIVSVVIRLNYFSILVVSCSPVNYCDINTSMDIYWLGQACFRLKGKSASVVIDPFSAEFTGLTLSSLEGDAVLVTHQHQDHNNWQSVRLGNEKPLVFEGPGEYEVKGAVVTGIPSFHDNKNGQERGNNTIYHILMDGLSVVHLGDLGQESLSEEQVQAIDLTDILLIPVGSVYTIAAKEAAGIVSQLEPKIIIPMHYKIPGLKFDLEPVDQFLKEMGSEGIEPQPKLSISKEKLPEEPMVVVLKQS